MVKTIFHRIAKCIDFCLTNDVVHCDIKPNNILLDEIMKPKLIDWSMSYKFSDPQNENTLVKGTKTYMAPEVVNLDQNKKVKIDYTRADCWSYGCMLMETLYMSSPVKVGTGLNSGKVSFEYKLDFSNPLF